MLWWQPPADTGSMPITGYVVTNPQIAYSKTMPANSNQMTITGLSAGIDYTFAIAAQNANGTGPSVNFKTVQVGREPSRPTNIVASLITDNDALVSWSYAQTAGEAPVRYFIITPVPVIPGSAPSTASWTYANFSNMLIPDLSTSIEYTFLVQAINDVRYSPYDSFSNNLIIQVSWVPTNILNIQFWFDASKIQGLADGERLTSWADQTGISAVNTAPMWNWPEYKDAALNGLSVIRFNPGSLLVVSPQLPVSALGPTAQSFFAVSRQLGGLNRRIFSSYLTNQYIGYNSGQKQTLYMNGPPDYYNNTPSDTNWDIISLVLIDNTSSNFYWNGTSIFTSNLANNIDSISFNGTGDTSDCEIAEVIFYNANLTTEERQVVEGYLAWKWALQANLPVNHPYKTSSPVANFTNKVPPTSFISLSLSSATSSSFTISWVGTTGATSFTYTLNGQDATPTTQLANSATFSNLDSQTGYTVVITARNLYGKTVSLPFTAYITPVKAQNISITNALPNGFTVNWDSASGATSYLYSLNGIITLPQADQGTTHGYATFTNLVPNLDYTIIVIAVNTGGQTPSDPFVAQTAPTQVSGLSAGNIGAFTFTLSWSAAAGATSYDYQITPAATVIISGTTAQVSNLSPITQYTVSIIANNAFGGTTSPSINITTLPAVFNPYIVGGSNTPIGAQITWASTTGVAYQYTISPGLNNAASSLIRNVNPPLTLTNLYPNSTYTITFAQIVGTVTAPTTSFTLTTQPSFPSTATILKYCDATISSFELYWNTGFATSSLTFFWGSNNITKPASLRSPITFSTLLSGTAYPVYIRATNITGSVSSLYIIAYTLPGPTYNLVPTRTTPTSITISWSGGNGAVSYIYTVNGIVTTPSTDNGVSGQNATFTGLDTNTAYIFTVTPVNDAGTGQTTYSPKSLSPYYWFDAYDSTTFSSALTNGNTSLVLTWSNKGSVATNAVITNVYPDSAFTYEQINGVQTIGLLPSSFFTLSPYISPLTSPTYSVFVIFKGITPLTNDTSYVFNMNPVAATSRILYKDNSFYMTTGQQTRIDYKISNILSPNALLSTSLYSMVINGAATSTPQGAWFNGSNQPTVSLNTGGVTGTRFNEPNSLGNDSSQGPTLKYNLGEFLIIPSALNTRDRQNVEGYLAWKWGAQAFLPSTHPNKENPPSGSWSFTSGPGAPTNLSTLAITFSSFTLNWQGALGANSLRFYVGASVLSTTNTTAPYTISSLSAFTTYPVYMVANSPFGSTSSNLISVQTAPSQPAIYASTITRNSFEVYYSNTTGASSLTIFYNTSSITVAASTTSPLMVSPLNSGSTYTVYIDAVNPKNRTLSNTILVTTLYPPPPAVALGRIGPGNSPYLAYSLDGVTNWQPITYPPWTNITGGIATNGPLYLMILNNDENTLYSSSDCKTWSPVGNPAILFGEGNSPTGVALNGIAYGKGIWIAVVKQWIFVSTNDGQSWRRSNQYFAGRVFYSHNKFFCESQATNQLQISTDGLNWERCITNMNANTGVWGLRSIVWDEVVSKYIASGNASSASSNATLFWTSPDGSNWTPASQSAMTWTTVNPSANYLTYAFNKWWTTNDSGYSLCCSSDHGLSWQGVSPAGLPKDLISLYANGNLVASSPSQGWFYTSDGITWSRLASANALSSTGYNGYYFIFGSDTVTP